MSQLCTHPHGDTVNGYWLCGKCYAKLPERPKTYRMVKGPRLPAFPMRGAEYRVEGRSRQEVFPVPIIRADSGFTLSEFIHAMARKLMAKAAMSKADALDYARDILEMTGEEFGNPDMAWDTDVAWELVKDDMQNWDYDNAGVNA